MARLLHLSDLHLVGMGKLASKRLDTGALTRHAIDTLLRRMDEIGPFDALLVTGDVSDNGSPESYLVACRELERIGLPVLAVPGNHDLRAPFRTAFSRWLDLPQEGPVNWVAEIGDTRVIGLDSLVEGRGGGRLTPETLSYLADAIATSQDREIVVALHHPPLLTGIPFMDAIGLENPEALAEIVSACQTPIRILAGHVHGVFHGFLGAHSVMTAPAICSAFALDRREEAVAGFWTQPTGFAVLDTAPGGVWTALPLEHGEGPFRF